MANFGRLDESLMHSAVPTGVQGFQQLMKGFTDGSNEVKNLLRYECDIITECKICKNMFRSVTSFITHKRTYCKDSSFEQIFPKQNNVAENSADNSANSTETVTTDSSETTLSLNLLDRWVKQVESLNAFRSVLNVPLHSYPEINTLASQKSLKKVNEERKIIDDTTDFHRQSNEDNRSGTSDQPPELEDEGKHFVEFSGETLPTVNKQHKDAVKLSSNLREKRVLKSPYDNSEFISSLLPKRSKRSPPNDCAPSAFKKRATSFPSTKHAPDEANDDASSNVDKFPVIFTHKQKEQALAMMDEKLRKCKECGAFFTNKCNMERHCYMHLGFVRFKCSQCEVGSFYRTELRRHLRCLCKNLKRSEGKTLTNAQLNRLIDPVCPDEPGKVTVWRSKTTWSNNFKGRKNIVYKPTLRKHPFVFKKPAACTAHKPSFDDDDPDGIASVNSPDDRTLSDIKRETAMEKEKKVRIGSDPDDFSESSKNDKLSSNNKGKLNDTAERSENKKKDDAKIVPRAQSNVQKIPLLSPRPSEPVVANGIETKSSTPKLLKPFVKVYKGTDGKIWAKPFFKKTS